MRTLATPQTKTALDALIETLEDHGGSCRRYEKVIVVESTTGKPMLNAIVTAEQTWCVQVTPEIADAFHLQLGGRP